ncbi:MAG: DNA-3-methyladenine glycosylase [Nitratireductor sp.]
MMRIRNQKDIAKGMQFLRENFVELDAIADEVAEVPLRLGEANFKGLASIVVSQQVSKASASAIFQRFETLINPLDAQNYIKCGEAAWKEIGLSRPKQRTLLAVSEAVLSGELDFEALAQLPAKEAIENMTRVKGIGPWTSEVYLLFCAGHSDIFPAGDLALQEAVKVIYKLNARPNDKKTREMVERFSPWRGVAARLLWAYYAVLQNRNATPV